MIEIYNQLIQRNINNDNIFLNESMKKHTSFKVGGKASIFIKVYSVDEIKTILKIVKENKINLFVLGNGTNVLFKDEDYHGIILQIKMDNIKIEDNIAIVDSGVKNSILASKLLKSELSGFEFASGIPGTVGGAIKMNAGAYGSEMKDIIQEVTYMDYDGNVFTLNNNECNFSYRQSVFLEKKCIILQCKLRFQKDLYNNISNKMKDLFIQRKEKQPLEYPNAGSTFKRGEDFITAKIIDECGLKGYKIGGAQVSEKHSGFIINKENATAKDILDLIQYVKDVVKQKTGREIKLEIEII